MPAYTQETEIIILDIPHQALTVIQAIQAAQLVEAAAAAAQLTLIQAAGAEAYPVKDFQEAIHQAPPHMDAVVVVEQVEQVE